MKTTNIKQIKPNYKKQNIRLPKVFMGSKEYHFSPGNLKISGKHYTIKHIDFSKTGEITINIVDTDLEKILDNKNNHINIIEKIFNKFKKKKNKRKAKHSNSKKSKNTHLRRPPHKPPKK